jgi:hypothetical protein
VALACDDFGTGYSGMESLFRLPFDSVKIDRVFLEGESGDRNWIMVEAMLRLFRDLGLDVVAEGIETAEQMERLSDLGCDFGQGYLIGPPVTAQQVVEALGGHSYGARDLGTGLAAFWTRLTGRKPVEEDVGTAANLPRPRVAAVASDAAEDPPVEAASDGQPSVPIAPEPSSAPAVPEVGSVPFAPRRVRLPDIDSFKVEQLDHSPPEKAPAGESAATWAGEPSDPELDREVVAGTGNGSADREIRAKRKAIRATGANALRRKARRETKAGPAGTGPAKAGPAKIDPTGTDPAENDLAKTRPPKTRPPKTRPANTQAAKTHLDKTGRGKTGRGKTGPAKTGPAKTGPVKTGHVKTSHIKSGSAKAASVDRGRGKGRSRADPVKQR